MTTAALEDLAPAFRAQVASLGYELERWRAARSVLAVRLAKQRLEPALEAFLTNWARETPLATAEVILGETPEGWRLLRGGLGEFAAERALLHLPALRSFWVRELRQAHFEALRKWVPEAWMLDSAPLPSGTVIAGLGIPTWREFPNRHAVEHFAVEDIAGRPRDTAWADWDDLVASRSHVLIRRIQARRSVRARFLRDARDRIVLHHVEALS